MFEYKFEKDEDYSSIKFVKSKKYSIEDTDIDIQDIENTFNNINKFYEEPDIPFPQADCFERVINLCELLLDEPKTKSEITENYAFDERQTNYYTDAARYLGLVDKEETSLTIKRKRVKQLDSRTTIPVLNITGNYTWGPKVYVIPEYTFAVEILSDDNIRLSSEHKEYKWVEYDEAMNKLKYDSNKTALWELNEKIKNRVIKNDN